MKSSVKLYAAIGYIGVTLSGLAYACAPSVKTNASGGLLAGDAATRTYVPPGSYDEYYAFLSGGFSGQVSAMSPGIIVGVNAINLGETRQGGFHLLARIRLQPLHVRFKNDVHALTRDGFPESAVPILPGS